jgi:hypothetical protein
MNKKKFLINLVDVIIDTGELGGKIALGMIIGIGIGASVGRDLSTQQAGEKIFISMFIMLSFVVEIYLLGMFLSKAAYTIYKLLRKSKAIHP